MPFALATYGLYVPAVIVGVIVACVAKRIRAGLNRGQPSREPDLMLARVLRHVFALTIGVLAWTIMIWGVLGGWGLEVTRPGVDGERRQFDYYVAWCALLIAIAVGYHLLPPAAVGAPSMAVGRISVASEAERPPPGAEGQPDKALDRTNADVSFRVGANAPSDFGGPSSSAPTLPPIASTTAPKYDSRVADSLAR